MHGCGPMLGMSHPRTRESPQEQYNYIGGSKIHGLRETTSFISRVK